jgi:hypothetical protein
LLNMLRRSSGIRLDRGNSAGHHLGVRQWGRRMGAAGTPTNVLTPCFCAAVFALFFSGLVPRVEAECVAGNGQVEFGEECDGSDFAGLGCQDLCFDSGVLLCNSDCTIDTSRCFLCGDNKICDGDPSTFDPGCNETCDGTDLNGASCGDGADPAETGGGILKCNPECVSYDRRGCFRCGDGLKNGTREACDGDDFGGRTCSSFGYGSDAQHTLHCSTTCGQILVNDCFYCGNGRVDPGEQCDAGPNNGAAGGYCDATCHTRCGDGVVQAPEACDDGGTCVGGSANGTHCTATTQCPGGVCRAVSGDGCSALCLVEHTTGGGCQAGTTSCTTTDAAVTPSIDACYAAWGIGGYATVPLTNFLVNATCAKGDPCDNTPTGPNCTFNYFMCFNNTQVGGGGPTCVPPGGGIAQVTSSDAGLLTSLRSALGGTLAGSTLTFSPAFTTVNRCVGAQLAVVPGTSQTLRIDTRSGGATPLTDHDELTFTCTPRLTCDPTTGNCQ